MSNTFLIIGANKELGKAVAIEFDKAGMKLILTAHSEDELDELNEIASNCKQAKVFAGSITEKETAQQLLDFALDSFGELHIMANNRPGLTSRSTGSSFNIDTIVDKICLFAQKDKEGPKPIEYVEGYIPEETPPEHTAFLWRFSLAAHYASENLPKSTKSTLLSLPNWFRNLFQNLWILTTFITMTISSSPELVRKSVTRFLRLQVVTMLENEHLVSLLMRLLKIQWGLHPLIIQKQY